MGVQKLLKATLVAIIFLGVAVGIFFAGMQYARHYPNKTVSLDTFSNLSPSPTPHTAYQQYSFVSLRNYPYKATQIEVQDILERGDDYVAYQFSFTTMDKKMTGQITIPSESSQSAEPRPVIVMNRGWAPLANYVSGTGTRPAARVFARAGYVTIAPDFFGYGGSDPEPPDTWEARFIKPISVIELLKTIQQNPQVTLNPSFDSKLSAFLERETTLESKQASESSVSTQTTPSNLPERSLVERVRLDPDRVALWGHSNGGQIAVSVLEITGEPLPTTLWAPVTAPFPYSLLYFTDEEADEGKQARKWISLLENNYDVFDFSITRHLSSLTAPLQIHHGTADTSALIDWSDEFVSKIEAENEDRADPISITYYRYPGANHNLQPNWETVVTRDLAFFADHFAK